MITNLVSNKDLLPKVAMAAKQVFPALFKLTYVTIKIISDSALKCLDILVVSLPPGIVVHYLEAPSQDTHAQARGKCAGCLALLLSKLTTADELQPLLPAVESLILRGLDDVSPDARSGSKTSYGRLQLLCPDRAAAMAVHIKEQVRKQLGILADCDLSTCGRGAEPDVVKEKLPRLSQRTDFRAARLQFRSKNAGQPDQVQTQQQPCNFDASTVMVGPLIEKDAAIKSVYNSGGKENSAQMEH